MLAEHQIRQKSVFRSDFPTRNAISLRNMNKTGGGGERLE